MRKEAKARVAGKKMKADEKGGINLRAKTVDVTHSSASSDSPKRIKVLVVFGTRPEVIKLAPVIEALRQSAARNSCGTSGATANLIAFDPVICFTGQHREMVEPFLEIFDLKPDYDLHVMQENQPLAGLTARLLVRLDKVLEAEAPDWVIVQGDTTTAMAASLAAFYRRIKVGHVEAGLRTEDKYNPFPEEINRRLISHLADLHFAPTPRARENLLREGLDRRAILVTGNTVVDALHMILKKTEEPGWSEKLKGKIKEIKAEGRTGGKLGAAPSPSRPAKLILVTAHRRESFGEGMERICEAINRLVSRAPEAEVIFPVHLNPNVRSVVLRRLSGLERVHLVEPLDYLTFVYLMRQADLILTDSGGIQEEAPSLGVPVIVMRDKTERPEAVEAGVAWLGGTDPQKIERLALTLLKKVESGEFRRSLKRRNPFGDGHAATRIIKRLGT